MLALTQMRRAFLRGHYHWRQEFLSLFYSWQKGNLEIPSNLSKLYNDSDKAKQSGVLRQLSGQVKSTKTSD